jgi:asparagine synthetase B (glutamine-hydrolysing)
VSGVAGWFDPDGVDPGKLAAAATATPYRGQATSVITDDAFAVCRTGTGGGHHRSTRSDLLLDGRIDAVLRGPAAHSTIDAMHERLDQAGISALNEFAGDFALALVSGRGSVLLARDAIGMRPMYVSRRGRRFAFASEPSILIALGFATDELDPPMIVAFLSGWQASDGRTAFRDVHEIPPGTWLRLGPHGETSTGTWFDPSLLVQGSMRHRDAVEALREALRESVISRARGRRVAIALSGGRDSGSVMVAAARAGIDATGITQSYDADLPVNEGHLAKAVCEAHAMPWMEATVASCPTWKQLEEVPGWSGGPITYSMVPESVALPEVASDSNFEVVMYGAGESLFSGSELVILDLVRRGRVASALRAAAAFRRIWDRPYSRQVKVLGRALAPPSLLRFRERRRPLPPWVPRAIDVSDFVEPEPRSDMAALVRELVKPPSAGFSLDERLYRSRGLEFTCPLLDLRVISIALSVDLDARAPIRTPKPLLSEAFLGQLGASRVKMSFRPYYRRLARRTQAAFPGLFSAQSYACQQGFVDPSGLQAAASDRWLQDSLAISVLEMWLRRPVGWPV